MRPANRIVTECPMLRARMQEMPLPMSVFVAHVRQAPAARLTELCPSAYVVRTLICLERSGAGPTFGTLTVSTPSLKSAVISSV